MVEHLQLGQNTVEFVIGSQRVQSFIYLFDWNIRLVISDIDGTITKSDVLGHVLTPFGVDWSHAGVTRLFSNIAANGYQFMYLSSRSIAQSGNTRAFLESLKQQGHALPSGTLLPLRIAVV
jgi:phosphatidate phosphatase LPIN